MYNQQQNIPLEYYRARYCALDPEETARRTCIAYDSAAGLFTLGSLGHTIYARWPEFDLAPARPEDCPEILYGFAMQMLAIRFLLKGSYALSGGEYKAYCELPWGGLYDANFRGRCIKRLAFAFGGNPDKFEKAAVSLGGVKLELGDASYDLCFLGNVTCRLILWTPDDEFPPSAQILFSDNTPAAFNAEDLAAVGDVIIGALKEVSKTGFE